MLSIYAFGMIATFMVLIMTNRLSPLVALIVVPIAFGIMGGFAADLGTMAIAGIRQIAPTGVMLLFAILYFGLMIDAGLFNPLVVRIVRIVGGDPVRITVGTAVLAMIVSLDGDGTTTYMITVTAMLPLYRHLMLDVRKMACIAMMISAATNLLPWGGPTARAATALELEPLAVFAPMLPAMLACIAWVLLVSVVFGVQERRRLTHLHVHLTTVDDEQLSRVDLFKWDHARDDCALRPRLLWFNVLLTVVLVAMLVLGIVPLPVLFVSAFGVAMMVNYPSLSEQKRRIDSHAGNALSVAGLIFAAGIFMGILSGTKMVDAMATSVIELVPAGAGPYMAPVTAFLSIPFTFLISNDAFYFGMLPTLAKSGAIYGISPEAVARASLIGQQVHLLSPLVPSTYLLTGMTKIGFSDHQRFSFPWALGSCFVMFLSSIAVGAFPVWSR